MVLPASRHNKFTLVELDNNICIDQLNELQSYMSQKGHCDISIDEKNNLAKISYSYSDHFGDNISSSKKQKLYFWVSINSNIIVCFTDKRSVLQEMINLLDILNFKTCKIKFTHDMLLKIISDKFFCDDVIGVKLESDDSGFVLSVSIEGNSVLNSDEFKGLINKNHKLTKIIINVRTDNNTSFVATIFKSGYISLSPYVSISDIIYFVNRIIDMLEA